MFQTHILYIYIFEDLGQNAVNLNKWHIHLTKQILIQTLCVTDIKFESIFQKLFRSKDIPALPILRNLDFVLMDLWRRNAFSVSLEHFHFALPHPGLGTWVDPVLRTGCFPSHFVRSLSLFLSIYPRAKGKTFG